MLLGLFTQFIIGPAEDEIARIVQYVGIATSFISFTKVNFISTKKLSNEQERLLSQVKCLLFRVAVIGG